jgi:hypothetical protein
MRNFCIVLVLLIVAFGSGIAAERKYQLFINGAPSKVQVLHGKEGVLVPLTLPANEVEADYTVSLVRDDEAGKVEVKLAPVKKKLRGDNDCGYCSGTGKCGQDYPAGSGLNYQGAAEYYCNGNGRCYHCSGTGRFQ